MVKKGTVLTPHADYCLPGITRVTVSIIRFQLEQLGPVYTSASFQFRAHKKLYFFKDIFVVFGHQYSFQGSSGFTVFKFSWRSILLDIHIKYFFSENAGMVLSAFIWYRDFDIIWSWVVSFNSLFYMFELLD